MVAFFFPIFERKRATIWNLYVMFFAVYVIGDTKETFDINIAIELKSELLAGSLDSSSDTERPEDSEDEYFCTDTSFASCETD